MGYLHTIISRIWETALESVGSHVTLSLGGILFLGFPVAIWASAYGYAIATKYEITTGLAVIIALALSAVTSAVFMFFYARLSDDSFAVITLSALLAMEALLYSWDSVTGGVLGIAGVPRVISGQTLSDVTFMIVTVVTPLILLYWLLLQSPFGRSLRALKENKPALTSLGTSPIKVGQIAIMIACLFSGVVAILAVSRIQFLDPNFTGIPVLIQVLTIAILTSTPKVQQLMGMTVLVVLLPEILRTMDLPVAILGHIRSLLYSVLLIVLLYYSLANAAVKRYV